MQSTILLEDADGKDPLPSVSFSDDYLIPERYRMRGVGDGKVQVWIQDYCMGWRGLRIVTCFERRIINILTLKNILTVPIHIPCRSESV